MKRPQIPVLFLDTETTGLDRHDRIFEIAWKDGMTGDIFQRMVNPGVPMNPDASKIHGVNKLDNLPTFANAVYEPLVESLRDRILCCHNVPFDVGMLRKEGLRQGHEIKDTIDTLELSRSLLDVPAHNLAYLKELYGLNTLTNHRALNDMVTLEQLFWLLFDETAVRICETRNVLSLMLNHKYF